MKSVLSRGTKALSKRIIAPSVTRPTLPLTRQCAAHVSQLNMHHGLGSGPTLPTTQIGSPELSQYEAYYNPRKVLEHPDFRLLKKGDPELEDPERNIACAYNEKRQVNMVNKPMPPCGPHECIVHVKNTGICGSDVHFWKHGQIGPLMVVRGETGAGHESAGEIVKVGEEVKNWKIGDRVAIEAGVPCGQADCDPCRTGRYNACPRVVFFSTPPYHGTLTRYHAHPSAWLHRLPDNVSFEEGSLCEPLAVALAGIERADIKLGDPLVICGAGPIGLVTLLASHAAGCTPIAITDIIESRLEFAKKLIPSVKTILLNKGDGPETNAQRIQDALGMRPRVAMECTGFESSITAAIYAVEFGGKVFVTGVGPVEQKYPFGYVNANEIDLQYQYRYANQYPKAIRLVAGGLINLKPLVTHRIPLNEAVEAFHIAADPTRGAIKVQICD